jgi:hypothetical protein
MSLALKPTHAAVKNYYAALNQVGQLHFNNEAQVSDAFANRADDKGYILRLIGQVITVSLETVKIVESLPPLGSPSEALEA